MKKLGLVAADTPVFEGHPLWPKWDSLSEAEKASEAKRMTVYAAMVDNMDQNIGRMLAYLKRPASSTTPSSSSCPTTAPTATRLYDVARTREWIHKDMDSSIAHIGKSGSYAEYGPGWAQVGSTPFRMFKSFMYEGGIAVPAIAWGPGVQGGKVKSAVAHVTDIAPTLFELAGTKHPGTEYQGKPVLPLRGASMLPLLQGREQLVHGADKAIGWELGGRKALRKGDWKMVSANQPWGTGEWELFNIAQDRSESRNLAASNPQKLGELLVAWRDYVRETGTLEIPNLANRPGYSNGAKYYEDLKYEATLVPRTAKP